ncbi:MAG: type II toxin-antitoxin system VapC family toxin [Candidatus Heimdallarchaeota archaeon]|nr:type II toxin-antitoxin system VapC family toxin [Candidatus Heimdallarchaeota archaeon]
MNYLADTDYLINLYRQKKDAIALLKSMTKEKGKLYTSAINVAELFEGAYKSNDVNKALSNVNILLKSFEIVDFSFKHAKYFGELISRLKGNEIGDMDTLIASIAISENFTIITDNTKHFSRTGVNTTTWII